MNTVLPSAMLGNGRMVEPIFDYQFRLILIGDSTVGKSSLLKYFTDGKFSAQCDPTVGVDFFARLIEVRPGVRVKLQLWDTAGQERFRSITRSYYRNSVGALLVYDITKRSSFENLSNWLSEAQVQIEPNKSVIVIIGHKSDQDDEREVSSREGRNFAEARSLQFIETSAKSGKNVEEAFLMMTNEVYSRLEAGKIKIEEGWDGVKMGFTRQVDETVEVCEGRVESGGMLLGYWYMLLGYWYMLLCYWYCYVIGGESIKMRSMVNYVLVIVTELGHL